MEGTPTPATTSVQTRQNQFTGTLFRDGDFPIYMLKDGRFAVEQGEWRIRNSVKAIERLLVTHAAELGQKLPVFQAEYLAENAHTHDVVSASQFELRHVVDSDGKKHRRGYGCWYQHEASLAAKLKALDVARAKREEEYSEKREALIDKLTRVTEKNFSQLVLMHKSATEKTERLRGKSASRSRVVP